MSDMDRREFVVLVAGGALAYAVVEEAKAAEPEIAVDEDVWIGGV
jgi:hypothetical protein